jgi:OOP family OmpA-OmpF porin
MEKQNSMKTSFKTLVAALALATIAGSARAADFTGLWGLGFDAGWGGRLGSQEVNRTAGNGLALGGSALYGITPHWRAALNYENINLNGKRLEPITASATYAFFPDRKWTPFAELGIGGSRATHIPDSSGNNTSLTGKAALGVEYDLSSNFTAAARASFYNAGRTSYAIGHEVDAAVLGVGLTYWFGGHHKAVAAAAKPAPAPEPVAAAPAPAPAPVVAPAPATTPAPAPAHAPKKISISLDVQFQTSKDAVLPQYDGKIADVAAFLKAHPAAKAEIEGHTDNRGSAAFNKGLSQRRADAVRAYIIKTFGIDGSRLTAKGYGSSMPIADNKTAEGRAQNRRVVATIDAQE